jgi:UDP-N-acetylmuramoyl-tripeptide--D-alanyl-D-alanine ligase
VLTLGDIIAYLAPGLPGPGEASIQIDGVCVDSRQAAEGSLFVALRGEKTDGHLYVDDAFRKGARAALVERPITADTVVDTVGAVAPRKWELPVQIVVRDSLEALQRLAQVHRERHPELHVVGVTGSVGKTTTKEAIASILASRHAVLRSAGNHNNEIGLPLTLLSLRSEHRFAVLEMGMYDLGEIAQLCDISRPRWGVITNVGPVHLERLGSIARIAQAKAELVRALPADGLAVLNGDDPYVARMREETDAPVLTFGLSEGNLVRAEEVAVHGLDGTSFWVRVNDAPELGLTGDRHELRVPALGAHVAMTALPGVALGLAAGLDWDAIQRGLISQGYGLRLVPRLGSGGVTILDDAYNASPASTCAAIELLAQLSGRHVAVLADMLELGPAEEAGHREVGGYCAGRVDLLVAVGPRAQWMAEEALEAGMPGAAVVMVEDAAAAIEALRDRVQPGDVVLVKGSRSMGMEAVVGAWRERV